MPSLPEPDLFIPARDAHDALTLRRRVWGEDHPHSDPAFFRWLFAHSGPETPAGIIVRTKGEATGFAALCTKPFSIAGSPARLAHGLDYMIAPGLSDLQMGRTAVRVASGWVALAARQKHDLGIVFPNSFSHRILTSRHVGLRPMFKPRLLVRPLRRACAHTAIGRLPAPAVAALFRLGALPASALAAGREPPGEAEPLDRFGPELDALWAAVAPSLPVSVVRDAAFLRWRFGVHPVYRYERLAWRRCGTLDGWLIANERDTLGMRTLLVVDMLVRPDDLSVGSALLRSAAKLAIRRGLSALLVLAIPGSVLFRAARRSGFFPVPDRIDPKPFRTAAITWGQHADIAWHSAAWNFGWADIDVV